MSQRSPQATIGTHDDTYQGGSFLGRVHSALQRIGPFHRFVARGLCVRHRSRRRRRLPFRVNVWGGSRPGSGKVCFKARHSRLDGLRNHR